MKHLGTRLGRWLSPYLPDAIGGCDNPLCQKGPWHSRRDTAQLNGERCCSLACFRVRAGLAIEWMFSHRSLKHRLHTHRVPIGLLLLAREKITTAELRSSLAEQRSSRQSLGEVMQQQGLVSEGEIASALATQWGLPVFASAPSVSVDSLGIPRELLLRHEVLPLHWNERTRVLFLGFVRSVDYTAIDGIEMALHCRAESCIVAESTFRNSMSARETQVDQAVFRSTSIGNILEVLCNYLIETGSNEVRLGATSAYVWARMRASERSAWLNLLFDLDPQSMQ